MLEADSKLFLPELELLLVDGALYASESPTDASIRLDALTLETIIIQSTSFPVITETNLDTRN